MLICYGIRNHCQRRRYERLGNARACRIEGRQALARAAGDDQAMADLRQQRAVVLAAAKVAKRGALRLRT
jgi:hypothetical protein